MWPLVAAAGLSVLGNLATNYFNSKNVDKQNAFNLDQWNRSNEYNTPFNQRQRLEQAGINPALALGNIQPGTAQSVMSAQHQPVVNPFQGVSEYTGQAIASKQVDAQVDLMKSQQRKVDADTTSVLLNNKHIPEYMKSLIAQQYGNSSLAQAKANTENAIRNDILESYQVQNALGRSNIELVNQKVLTEQGIQQMNDTINRLNLYKLKYLQPVERQQLQAMVKSVYSSIALNSSQVRLNDANVGKVKADTRLTHYKVNSEVLNQDILTKQSQQMAEYIQGLKIDNRYKVQLKENIINELKARANYYDKSSEYYQWQKWTNAVGEVNKALSTVSNFVTRSGGSNFFGSSNSAPSVVGAGF